MRIKKLMSLHRLMDAAGDGSGGKGDGGGSGAGGSSSADDGKNNDGNGGSDKGSKLTDKEAELLRDVMGKKKKLDEANSTIAELTEKIKQFDGIDPVAVRELLNKKADDERRQLEEKGEFGKLRDQMVAAHEGEKTKLSEQIANLDAENASLRAQIAEMTVGSAFVGSKYIGDELVLTPAKTRVIYGSHFEFKDGAVVAYDKPAGAADRTVLIDGKGNPLSFEEAIAKIIAADPEKDQIIRSKLKSGAGSGTSTHAGAADTKAKVEVRGRERIAAALSVKK